MHRTEIKLARFLFLFSFLFSGSIYGQFYWTAYAKHASASRGLTFTRDAYTYSTAGAGTLAGNTMSVQVSHVGPNQGSDITNSSFSCATGAPNQIQTSTEYFSTGTLDPCFYYCPPLEDPGLVTTGLWVGVDWPNKTSNADVDMTFTLPVYNLAFDIYDINQNVVSIPFSDLLIISGITCTGATVYPVSVTNLDPPYTYNSGNGTIAPSNNTTLGPGALFSAVTFANIGLVSVKISYRSNPVVPAPNPANPDYQFVIVGDIMGSSSAGTPLTATASPTVLCAGSSTTLTAGGGFTSYAWSPGGSTSQSVVVTPTTGSTTYTVVGSNAGGCPVTATVAVTASPPPVAAATSATICAGQTATLTASGGGNYSWSTGQSSAQISVSPAASTSYSVVVSIGTCSDTAYDSVTVVPAVVAAAGPNTTICPGQSATLSASGGGSYAWSNGASTSGVTVSPSVTTSYSVSVSNGQCSGTASATVTVNNVPAPVITGNTVICAGDMVTLTASGGTGYSWSTGATTSVITATPTSSTSYTVTATNANGCVSSATVSVTVAAPPLATASSATICAGQTATLNAGGPGNYSWSTGQSTNPILVSPTASTTYSVVVSAGSCWDTAFSTVTVLPAPAASISGNLILCVGDILTLTASGGTSYSWSTGASTSVITASPTVSTAYTVVVTNSSGCTSAGTVSVTVATPPLAMANNATICSGQTATLNAGGPGNYSWSTGQTTNPIFVSPAASATYSVIVSAGTCSDTAFSTVTVVPTPAASITGNIVLCAGDVATLTASGGVSYSWSNGSTSNVINVSPTSNTSYSVIAINSNNCTATTSVTVTVLPPPIASAGGTTVCAGQNAVLIATGGNTYLWSNGATTTSISTSATGTYTVIVWNGSCSDTAVASVLVNPVPVASAYNSVTITQGQGTTLGASGGGTYLWSNGDTDATISVSPTATAYYCVTVTNSSGCTDSACVLVTVVVEPIDCSSSANGELYIPNAFSPNGDLENDRVQLFYGNYDCIETYSFTVYNRWGEKVFEADSPLISWDGTHKGKPENSALFVWYMKAVLVGGEKIERKGNISLMR